MKKTLTALLICGSVSLPFAMAQGPGPGMRLGGPGREGGFGGFLGGRVVTGAPYSGTETLTIQEKFADGNSVNTTTSTPRARDSQGRTYTSETITPAAASGRSPYTRITITDPVAGYRYELNSSTMIALQTRMPQIHTPVSTSSTTTPPALMTGSTTRPDGAVVTVTALAGATVNGVPATGTQATEVIPAGAIGNAQAITTTRTTWVSTDLKMPVQIKSSDPRFGSSDMELTNISTGEPSAALFTVPAGYTTKTLNGRGGGPGGPGGQGGFGRQSRGPRGGGGGPVQ